MKFSGSFVFDAKIEGLDLGCVKMHTIEYLERNANTCTYMLHFKQRMGKAQLHETGGGDSRILISQT